MRAVLAIVAVVGLGMLVILGANAGEVPSFNFLQPSQSDLPAPETAAGAEEADLEGNQESDKGQLFDLSEITSIGSNLTESISIPAANLNADATNGQCWPVVVNPGFEERTGWDLPLTEYSAEYSQEAVYAGSWAARTGITDPLDVAKYEYSSTNPTLF